MANRVRAAVLSGPGRLAVQTFPLPAVSDDDALLEVESCGICGTDVELFTGGMPTRGPIVLGHEPVGRIVAIGARAAARWGLGVGDRVVLPAEIGCGHCPACAAGAGGCTRPVGNHGFVPVDTPPALWGGFAEVLHLAPGSTPLRIADHVDPRTAALFNLLGAGFSWGVHATGIGPGSTLAVFGPGQRGLACVLAAREIGAGRVFVTGIGSRDAHKLRLAADLGAETIDVETDDAPERILAATGGVGVDAAVDTTPHATGPVLDALRVVRPGGTVVLAGLKGPGRTVPGIATDDIAVRRLTVRGVRAVDAAGFRAAIALLEAGTVPADRLCTHHFALDDAAAAIAALQDPASGTIAVSVGP